MWGRAEQQAGDGAGALFARLDAPGARREEAIGVLERLAARLRAGAWNAELAHLLEQAAEVERALAAAEGQPADGA